MCRQAIWVLTPLLVGTILGLSLDPPADKSPDSTTQSTTAPIPSEIQRRETDRMPLPRPSPPNPQRGSGSIGYRGLLNNFLQSNGGTGRLRYVDATSGPAHQPTWNCTAYSKSGVPCHRVCLDLPLVDGVPYAEGRGRDKGEARENAARNCYMILSSHL